MASQGAPGTRMTSTVSINISTPAFYNPQKKFAPVVAPKPKVNPFKAGGALESSLPPPPGTGAQRAQMGKVGEIPSQSLPAEGRWGPGCVCVCAFPGSGHEVHDRAEHKSGSLTTLGD